MGFFRKKKKKSSRAKGKARSSESDVSRAIASDDACFRRRNPSVVVLRAGNIATSGLSKLAMHQNLLLLLAVTFWPACEPRSARCRLPKNAGSAPFYTTIVLSVSDLYQERVFCEGVAAERMNVLLDGKLAGQLTIPCIEGFVAPARQYELKIRTRQGAYSLAVHTLKRKLNARRLITVPVRKVNAKVEVVADESHIRIWILSNAIRMSAPRVLPLGEL